MDSVLSDEEARAVVAGLAKLEPGFLPFDIFHQLARLNVMPIIEVVPLRTNAQGDTEILLVPRPADDPNWPGQLHIPGTTIRSTDEPGSYTSALRRILDDELEGTKTSEPVFVRNVFHYSGRGMETSQVYWVEVGGEPAGGSFYPVNELPETIVSSQMDFIPLAIESYKQR
jgi:hypothetical protein